MNHLGSKLSESQLLQTTPTVIYSSVGRESKWAERGAMLWGPQAEREHLSRMLWGRISLEWLVKSSSVQLNA